MPPKKNSQDKTPKHKVNPVTLHESYYPLVEEAAADLGRVALLVAETEEPLQNETSRNLALSSAWLIGKLPERVAAKHGSPFPEVSELIRVPPPKAELWLYMEDLDPIDNGIIQDMAAGRTPRESADRLGIKPRQFNLYQANLLEEFEAINTTHLMRKVVEKKFGKLPMKEIRDYPLDTKMQLTVLQYLSFGFTLPEMALTIQNRDIRNTEREERVLFEILDLFKAKNAPQAVYTGFNYGLLGCEDDRFIGAKEVERVAARKGLTIAEDD